MKKNISIKTISRLVRMQTPPLRGGWEGLKIIIFLLLSLPLQLLLAQSKLDSMIIISVGEYKPSVMDASKINDNPMINDSTKKLPVSGYGINSKQISTGFDVELIKPAQMMGEPLTKLYNALLKVGMGTYTSPYGELWINNLRSKEISFGERFKHLSSSYDSPDHGYAGFSDDEVSLYGKKFLTEHTLLGNFDYTRNMDHFYGYNALANYVNRDSTKQVFNLFSANTELVSHYTDPKRYNHDIKLSFYNLSDKFNTSENNIKATGTVQTTINKEVFNVNSSVDYYNYKNSKDTINNTIVSVNPNFIRTGEKYHVNLGFTATMDAFVQSKFYFYPNVDFSYNVFENIIIPYAGIKGGLQKNSYKSFTDENPFVLSELTIMNSNKKVELYGGIKGTLSSTTAFNASASFSNINNMAMFVNDTKEVLQNKFNVIYDDATVLNIIGEVSYQELEKLRINLRGEYFNYKMKTELEAWYMPQVKLSISANYNLRDKISLKVDLFYLDNQYTKTFVTDVSAPTGKKAMATIIKGTFDANIGLDYRYNKKLGFFLNFNNIANYRYLRWSNYPTQGFSIMGGLSYSF